MSLSGGKACSAGASTLSVSSQLSSSSGFSGLCWAERTTASSRRGFPSSPYSTVTCAFPQAPYHPGFPGGREGAGKTVRQHHRQRHHLRRFRTGIAHHDALISGPELQGGLIFREISPTL